VSALTIPVAAQDKRVALDIRALSTRPELVSGGDVLVQVYGPANLTAKNLAVRLNGKDVSAAFKPAAQSLAPSAVEGKALVGLVTGLNVGSNSIQASMRGNKATAQLVVVNHPMTGPVLYSPHQTPFICETQASGLGAPLDADCSATTKVEYFYRSSRHHRLQAESRATSPPRITQTASAAAAGGAVNPFKPFDPNGPRPTDIAMTTTTRAKRCRTSSAARWARSIARSIPSRSCTSPGRRFPLHGPPARLGTDASSTRSAAASRGVITRDVPSAD